MMCVNDECFVWSEIQSICNSMFVNHFIISLFEYAHVWRMLGFSGYEKPWDWKPEQKDDRPPAEYEKPWDQKAKNLEAGKLSNFWIL